MDWYKNYKVSEVLNKEKIQISRKSSAPANFPSQESLGLVSETAPVDRRVYAEEADKQPEYTAEEIQRIDKEFSYYVFDWAKNLIEHIVKKAQAEGINKVYMNTSATVDQSSNADKRNFIYETVPRQMGASLEPVNFRGERENLWLLYDRGPTVSANRFFKFLKLAQNETDNDEKFFTMEEISQKLDSPKGKRFFGYLLQRFKQKGKPRVRQLTLRQIKDAHADFEGILQEEKEASKKKKGLGYIWVDKKWDGGQQYISSIPEQVVVQTFPETVARQYKDDPLFSKFLVSVLLHPGAHFFQQGSSFALISPVKDDVWVINQVQNDFIKEYLKLRNQYQRNRTDSDDANAVISLEEIEHLLVARGKGHWVDFFRQNESAVEAVQEDQSILDRLTANESQMASDPFYMQFA